MVEFETPSFLQNTGSIVPLSELLLEEDDANEGKTPTGGTAQAKPPIDDEIELPGEVEVIKSEKPAEEVLKEEPPVDEPPATGESQYKDFITRMVIIGEWTELEEIEMPDGTKIPFAEAAIDEETFNEIAKFQGELKREALLADRIEAKGLSEFTRNLVEIEKNGGNVAQALELYNQVLDPLASLDMDTPEGNKGAIYMELKNKGLDDKTIESVIKGYIADGKLEEEGSKSKKFLDEASAKMMEKLNQDAITAKETRTKQIKEYKKMFSESLSRFELNDPAKKKLVDAATKEDENGRFEVDKVYQTKRKDPKEADELTYFLMDKEGYLKQKFGQIKTEEQLNTFKKMSFVKKAGDSTNITRQNPKENTDEIDLNNLK